MHIIDGVLEPAVWVPLAAVAPAGVLVAERSNRRADDDRRIPLMGVLGAFIFAAQMVNIPIGFGTSGHLTGGALLAMLVGPSAAILVMTCILIIQCLILQDGGFTALGANVVNLAIIGPLVGWALYRLLSRLAGKQRWASFAIPFLAGWASVVAPAAAAALELGVSPEFPLLEGFLFLVTFHVLIGILEGAITAGVVRYLAAVKPEVVPKSLRPAAGGAR